MSFTVLILNKNEEPLFYLDSEKLDIEETSEMNELRSINFTYPLDSENIQKTRNIFKIGNKIWIPGTNGLEACLYVISSSVKYDYWDKNYIEVSAEEVLVELNYVELFQQYSAETKTINEKFLNEQFSNYFNILKVEKCVGSQGNVALNGTMTKLELLRYIEEKTSNIFITSYEKDKNSNIIHRYLSFVRPSTAGKTHNKVIDLSFNAENIEFEVDESNTFRAIAPIFSLTTSTTGAEMSRTDLGKIIESWKNFAVKKGSIIPMIVEKNTDANGKITETITAKWAAPFKKQKGELFIRDDNSTGAEYETISSRKDLESPITVPKIGTIETTETNINVIYNKCANTLITKRYPEVSMDVDLKDLEQITENNSGFDIYDKVYVKIPDYGKLIRASVEKIIKNPQLPGETQISLANAEVGTKINQIATTIKAKNTTVTYAKGQYVSAKLVRDETIVDEDEDHLSITNISNKICSITITKPDTQKTVNVPTTSKKTQTKNKTLYSYNKYGVSSDGKYIMAIGKPSAPGESSKYKIMFYKSVFKRKCPSCGSNKLYWSIFYAGNETGNWGRFPATGKIEGGSAEGHIFCANCDADFSCIDGKDHNIPVRFKLHKHEKTVKSSKSEAYKLKRGNMKKTKAVTVSSNVKSVTQKTVNVPGWTKCYTKKTDENGIFKLKINLEKGEYTVNFHFGGDIEYSASSTSIKLIVK